MAAPKFGKTLARFLESRGYVEAEATRTGSRWEREGSPTIKVPGGITESRVRAIMRDVDKLDGVASISAIRKRNTSAIRERQQTERERLAEERRRRSAELAEYEAAMDARLGSLTTAEWNAVCAEIERREREIRELDRLMRSTPDQGHRGVERAKHRA